MVFSIGFITYISLLVYLTNIFLSAKISYFQNKKDLKFTALILPFSFQSASSTQNRSYVFRTFNEVTTNL